VQTPTHSGQVRGERVLPFSYEEGPNLQCEEQLMLTCELSLGHELKPHYPEVEKWEQAFPPAEKQQFSESSLKEDSLVVDWDYLAKSEGVSPATRLMLVHALLEYSAFIRHQRETFYLAVEFMDLFASLQPALTPALFKTIGVTALVIAIKKEENADCMAKLASVSNLSF
jgi:hypothetical protein